MMPRLILLSFILASFLSAGVAQDDPKVAARAELNAGVQAFRQANYEEAVGHFEQAVALDPQSVTAHLYLATAYAQTFAPGVDTPENVVWATKALNEYREVLQLKPSDVTSLKGIAYLEYQLKNFDQAKENYKKAVVLDPSDPESFYSIGVIDWTACYQPRMEERAKLGMKPDEHLSASNKEQKKVCEQLKPKNEPYIQEGIDSLNKAIQLRPDYDDAMAYMNLMYREKADVECDDAAARTDDLKTADGWVDKTLAVKKAKAEKAAQNQGGGITMDQSK